MVTIGKGSGFLSKVAKFVRHPTKDWSELDQVGVEAAPDTEQDKGYDKQALKEMIERKRRNDFVRGREFDQLRKLRANIPVAGADRNGRPSFFLASTNASHLEERASTIKKIDDIEAQMSKQWWKGKPGEPAGRNSPVAQAADASPDADDKQTEVPPSEPSSSQFSQTQPPQSFSRSELGEGRAYAATQPIANWQRREPGPRVESPVAPKYGNFSGNAADAKEFSLSGLFSIELGDSLVDPDMEEAAIRFANGDDAGAEEGLLAVLRADKVRRESAEGWAAALFDLYRATGQRDSFARLGIECAQRFGQAAPLWFSTPERLLSGAETAKPGRPVIGPVTWVSPAELDLPVVQALQGALSSAPAPWHLDWRALRVITPSAGAALADLFALWCGQGVALVFSGVEQFEKILKASTPAGDRQVDMFWWHLRLDALRIMGLQDEFELAALDFCVIHEVAPPPWENARCAYADASGATPAYALTEPSGLEENAVALLELKGEIRGDATDTLGAMQIGLPAQRFLDISCDRLIRVDFSAAGSILNWVMARETEGIETRFFDVPCLIAAFFNVIGINEHAKVLLRNS